MTSHQPEVSEKGRHRATIRAERLVTEVLNYDFSVHGARAYTKLHEIAEKDLQSNYEGVRRVYLAVLRQRIEPEVYEALLDGPLDIIASSTQLVELAEDVKVQARLGKVDAVAIEACLEEIARVQLQAGPKAVRGAFLGHLESILPESTLDQLIEGDLNFLTRL